MFEASSGESADLRCVMAGVLPRMIHIQMNQKKESEISLSKQNVRALRYLEYDNAASGGDGMCCTRHTRL